MSVSQYASLGGVWSGKGQYRKQKVNEILPQIFQTEKKKKKPRKNETIAHKEFGEPRQKKKKRRKV